VSAFRHLFTADIEGYALIRLELVSSTSFTAGDHVTGDYTVFTFYKGRGSKRDEIGSWDSRKNSIRELEALPMITREIKLSVGDVVHVKGERHGQEAPALREFDVQPTIQFKGA
jgi:hypothetical protein